MNITNYFRRAAERDREREFLALVVTRGFRHAFGFGPSKTIDILIWVSNTNETTFDESFKQCVINRGKVLVFVHKYDWVFRIQSSKQCGHIYLIIKVEQAIIALSYASCEYRVNESCGKV